MNDDDMYDEFGNYLGPEVGVDSDDNSNPDNQSSDDNDQR